MNEAGIRRYERALGKSVRGTRLRKKVKETFRAFLLDLQDELDVQDYDALLTAFGPPEQMAQTLVQSFPDIPGPMSRKKKIVLAIVTCIIFIILFVSVFLICNRAETNLYILEGIDNSTEETLEEYVFMADGIFAQEDIEWDQDRRLSSYVVLLENTNQVSTKITVRYSDYHSPHVFEIPPGEQMTLWVNDARHSQHIISFATPDGTFSGTVRIFVS